jgi:hypothetical protein
MQKRFMMSDSRDVGFYNITSPSIKDIERERHEEYPKDTPAIPTCH